MLVAGAVGGRAVGEVDWVRGGDRDGFGVEVDGGLVVFSRHGGVALAFEQFAFGGGGAWCSCSGGGWGGWFGCCCAAAGGGLVFEFLIDAVD